MESDKKKINIPLFVKKDTIDTSPIASDIDEAIKWAEERNLAIELNQIDIDEDDVPTLLKVVLGGEDYIGQLPSDKKDTYETLFAKNSKKNPLAPVTKLAESGAYTMGQLLAGEASAGTRKKTLLTGAGLAGIGAFASSIAAVPAGVSLTSLSAGTLGLMGAAGVVAGAWPIGIGLVALGVLPNLIKSNLSKEQAKKLEEVYSKTQKQSKNAVEKIKANNSIIENLQQQIQLATDKINELTKKASIKVDDAIHSSQNERLLEYNQIVYNQGKEINELKEKVNKIIQEYNRVVEENDVLQRKVAAYEMNMRAMASTAQYIK